MGDPAADLRRLIDEWRSDPEGAGNVTHVEYVPPRPAAHGTPREPLPVGLRTRLAEQGIDELYVHQAQALDAVGSGSHTVVVAGTAAGKSLAYQVPIAAALEVEPSATALALYPTKALARDQLAGFQATCGPEAVVAVYDGDTPTDERPWVRRNAGVVLANPDMLHVGILPHHERWRHFLGRLRFVVVDEIHTLRGVFGSHVALVLRRLRRLAARYGADPVFVFTSATIGNPGELAASLAGVDVTVVDADGAPRSAEYHLLWNPELVDEERGIRGSPLTDATRVFSELVSADLHTIVFSRSRKSTELIYRWARDRLDVERAARIAPYRAGYLPAERRRIEQQLFGGELLGVVATNALELGIDVGGLDAAVITTFPGTIASYRQQAGRSGRRRRASLAVLVAGQDALDQYYLHHPTELFTRTPEAAVVNPDNPAILRTQVCCAAAEAPLVPDDRSFLGPGFEELLPELVADGSLGLRAGALYWAGGGSPARSVSIRATGGAPFTIVDREGAVLGTVDVGRVFTQCHPGAVYLHQGDSFVVDELLIDEREVRVERRDVGYYTQPRVDKDLAIVETRERSRLGDVDVVHGTVRVVTEVIAFQRRSIATGEPLETLPLDLPPSTLTTEAVWFGFPDTLVDAAGITSAALPGTLHAAEHTAIAMLPLFAICDRWDVGGLSIAHHPQLGMGGFFVYDGYEGGAGIAPIAFARAAEHLAATLAALEQCPCLAGCPSCVQSPKCGNFNEPLDKDGAAALLAAVVGAVAPAR